jgi:hypothetical protein
MADTIKLPALGNVKKQYVYIGGALVVGIVGYAYWTRAAGGAAEPGPAPLEPTPEDYAASFTEGRDAPPTMVGSGSYDDFGAGQVISTNTEWFTAATSSLVDAGYEPITVINTLGKFLQRKPLSTNEQVLVQAAKGFVGEPPLGGPWPIIGELPPPASTPTPAANKLATPTGLRLTVNRRGYFEIRWNAVPGAQYYTVKGGGVGHPRTGPVTATRKIGRGGAPGNYTYWVRAHAAGKTASDWSAPLHFRSP